MKSLSRRHLGYLAATLTLFGTGVFVVAATASGNVANATPAGLKLFTSSGCGGCHTFKAASAKGTLGPNLDKPKLTKAQIVKQITLGGSVLLGKAAAAKYKASMPSFKGRLTKTQIATLASWVLTNRNKAPAAGSTTTTKSPGGGASTTTTTPGGGTTTQAGGATTTTTTSSGGSDTTDNCPAGKTIATSGNSDADDDDNGAQSDGDGCI